MRRGEVDVVIVGADRVAANGDVCNKIGTYEKALAAQRQRRAVLRRAAVADARHGARRPAPRFRSRRATPDEVLASPGATAYGQTTTVAIAPARHARGQSTPSTSRRRGSSPGSSPSAASPRAERAALAAMFPERAAMSELQAMREAVIAAAREMNALGINRGKSGNVSARYVTRRLRRLPDHADRASVRATMPGRHRRDDAGRASARGAQAAVVRMAVPSRHLRVARRRRRDRPHACAVRDDARVHAIAAYPPFHYMVAVAGGRDIRCAPYATFGTQELSDHAVAALDERRACLLAHHGMIATGATLDGRARRSPSRSRRWPRCTGGAAASASPSSCSDAEMDVVARKVPDVRPAALNGGNRQQGSISKDAAAR